LVKLIGVKLGIGPGRAKVSCGIESARSTTSAPKPTKGVADGAERHFKAHDSLSDVNKLLQALNGYISPVPASTPSALPKAKLEGSN